MISNLARLRELTAELDIAYITPEAQVGDHFVYDFNIPAKTHGLCHTAEVAVARLEMEKGTVFPPHTHSMLEVFIVLDGEIEFEMCNSKWSIKKGSPPLYTLPNIPHGGKAITDVTILCITIPSDSSYPHPEEGG